MRRRELSDGELNEVIKLRQTGASWLRIQRETRIHRQTAKRAYEKWEHSKSMDELKKARTEVAAEAFREHVGSLVMLATYLVANLAVSDSLTDMEKDAEQFFHYLLEQDLLERYGSSERPGRVHTGRGAQSFCTGDQRSYRREKELLFESLKVHTRDQVRWGDVFDNRWKKARDNCAKILPKLRREAHQMVNNFVNRQPQENLLESIKEASQRAYPIKDVAETALGLIWRDVLQDKLDEEGPWFETISSGTQHDVCVKPRQAMFSFAGSTGKSLAEKVTRMCNQVVYNLRKGDTAQQLHREVREMKKASDELLEMLNPVKLRPMILRTQCDLCPA